jgi:hypothetical protein
MPFLFFIQIRVFMDKAFTSSKLYFFISFFLFKQNCQIENNVNVYTYVIKLIENIVTFGRVKNTTNIKCITLTKFLY